MIATHALVPNNLRTSIDVASTLDGGDLRDVDWAWRRYCERYGQHADEPESVRALEITQVRGRRARATYEAEWPEDVYIPNQRFTLERDAGEEVRVYRFPDDPELPGLAAAADPEAALDLVKRHVMSIPPRRIRVEVVRYRPGSHAVVRHRLGKARFYARVMKPDATSALLDAAEVVARSNFAVPRIAGYWRHGGVVWTSEIPGENMRQYIRAGKQPDPDALLEGLQSLWAVPRTAGNGRPFDLGGRYRGAKREIGAAVRDHTAVQQEFDRAVASLDPLMRSWQPSVTAHNDFYDDQLLVLPDGRLVLVDFEETGPGDPMLDVGNFLAHLRWSAMTGTAKRAPGKMEYHRIFKDAALDRFGWDQGDLGLREGICLFRTCIFAVIRPRTDWPDRLTQGLSLVNEAIG